MAYVHSDIPRISEAGLMGYSFIFRDGAGKISWVAALAMVNGTADEASDILKPLYANLTNSKYKDHIIYQQQTYSFPDYMTYFVNFFRPEVVGSTAVLPSRLLDSRALTEDPTLFAATLKKMWSPFVGAYLGHIVGGPGVAQYKDVDMALNPAWRRTYNHFSK